MTDSIEQIKHLYDLRKQAMTDADLLVRACMERDPLAPLSNPIYSGNPTVFSARHTTSIVEQRIDLTLRVASWLVDGV